MMMGSELHAKSIPPRSTQVAGSAIVQGAAVEKSVKHQTRGNSVKNRSAAYGGPGSKDMTSTKNNYDPLLEGLLTSKQVGIVASSAGDHLEMTPGPMRGGKGNTTLSVTGTMEQQPRVQSTMTGSIGGYGAVTPEDINDRMLDSPKSRSYVPLLSKKLKKNGHGSTENVMQAVHPHHHMTEQRQPS